MEAFSDYTMRCSTLITLCVVPLVFLIFHAFFTRFSRVFPRVYDTNMLVSKTRVKTQEKCKKNARKIQNTMRWAKNASQLRFARVLLAFCSRFACVLLAFCLRFARSLLALCS